MSIDTIKAIIKSSKQTDEFVLHVPSEYDYRYVMEGRDEFIEILQLRYANLDPRGTLKIYEVPSSLKPFTTTLKDRKYGIFKLPDSSCRQRDKELAGTDELDTEELLEPEGEVVEFRGSMKK